MEEALKMEEGASSSSLPPPPALPAKMPIGKEPWRKVEKRTGPEDRSSRIARNDDRQEQSSRSQAIQKPRK